jgi:hypothetical protein
MHFLTFCLKFLTYNLESLAFLSAPVAQWIEHRPPEPRVGGSNPLRRAGKTSGPLAQLVEQLTLNQRVAGSNPARLTNFFKDLRRSENSPNRLTS